jgi:hypothetical protein
MRQRRRPTTRLKGLETQKKINSKTQRQKKTNNKAHWKGVRQRSLRPTSVEGQETKKTNNKTGRAGDRDKD